MQRPVVQADAAGFAIQRPGVFVGPGQGVEAVVPAGHAAKPGIRHRGGGGSDLGEDAQRVGGVTGPVVIHCGVE